MNKVKLVLWIIVFLVLGDFAWENKVLQPQELKLFTFTLGQIPSFLLAYICLTLGLTIGWLGHALRIRKKRKQAAAVLSQEKQAQAQQSQEASN